MRADVLVRTRPDTQPGTYTGELSVWPAGLPHNGRMVRVVVHGVTIPGDPSPGTWGAERRAEFSPLGSRRLFLGPGLRLGARWNRLGKTVKTRKKRGKTGKKWARYGLKRVDKERTGGINWLSCWRVHQG